MTYALYVPSRSRWGRSLTLEALDGDRPFKVYLVVPSDQFGRYQELAKRHRAVPLACPEEGIALTRLWCGKHAQSKGHSRFIMVDDDLRFTHRTSMDSPKLFKSDPAQVIQVFDDLASHLRLFAHGSIDARQGNNSRDKDYKYPLKILGRMIRVLGYQTNKFLRVEHGRVPVMEDFDVTLQLLKRGYPNIIITDHTQDQQQTQLPGGCSDYRQKDLQEAAALELHRLHPDVVQVVEKSNSTGGDFGKRTDVRISWEGAYRK